MPARSKIDYQMFEQDYASGITISDMAVRYQLSRSTVQKIARRIGMPKRRHGSKPGEMAKAWKGGRMLMNGYWYVYSPLHPNRTGRNYVSEHRLVMESVVGRYLDPKEVVHHRDRNPQNNHPDNLVLFRNNAHHLREELIGSEKHREAVRQGMTKYRQRIALDAGQLPLSTDHPTL